MLMKTVLRQNFCWWMLVFHISRTYALAQFFASLIRLLIGSLSIDAMIDICHMAGPDRWRSVVEAE